MVRFRITRRTAKRIYYIRAHNGPNPVIGYVDRQRIERDGEVARASAGWWEDDRRVHLRPPEPPQRPQVHDLVALRTAMVEAHPDRGGSHEAFLIARQKYEDARSFASNSKASNPGMP